MAVETVLNVRRAGLKDIHIAVVKKNSVNEYETDTPIKLGRSISAKVTVKKNVDKTFSDDGVENVVESDGGIDIEIDVNKLTPSEKAILRGATYKNGMLIYNKNDMAKEIAIGWRAKQTNGKYEFVWYYCGKFNNGWSEDYETQQDKIKTQTQKLKGQFYGREKDGNTHSEIDESYLLEEHNSAKSAIESWFTKVQEPIEK